MIFLPLPPNKWPDPPILLNILHVLKDGSYGPLSQVNLLRQKRSDLCNFSTVWRNDLTTEYPAYAKTLKYSCNSLLSLAPYFIPKIEGSVKKSNVGEYSWNSHAKICSRSIWVLLDPHLCGGQLATNYKGWREDKDINWEAITHTSICQEATEVVRTPLSQSGGQALYLVIFG